MDIVDPATRSRMMSSVGQRNTKPELELRRALHRSGLRYRLHDKRLPGRPDLVFPRFRAVIFVHGCFWHAHECRLSKVPATRAEFWEMKFSNNRQRDARVLEALRKHGWRTAVVWQCALSSSADVAAAAGAVATWLASGVPDIQLPPSPSKRRPESADNVAMQRVAAKIQTPEKAKK